MRDHSRSTRPCDLACVIGASGIDDDDFITTRKTRDGFRNAVLLVECDDRSADGGHGPDPQAHAITDRMRNLKLTLAYDGTDFHGWQIQPHLRTIQGELQCALQKMFNHEVSVTGS